MSIQTSKLPFLTKSKLHLKGVPPYLDFKGLFFEKVDLTLCSLISEDKTLAKITTDLFKSTVMKNIRPNGIIPVIHSQRYGLGRFYSDSGVSIIPHSRLIKHTLMSYSGWKDLDQIKGHATIALEVFKDELNLPSMKYYVENFEKIVNVVIKQYSVEESPLVADDVKLLYNASIYGGDFNTWIKAITTDKPLKGYVGRKMKNTDVILDVVDSFIKECRSISVIVNKANPTLVRKLKKDSDTIYDTKNRVVSYFFQIVENHVLYVAYQYLVKEGIITARNVALEYDGLGFPPNGKVYDEDILIEELNKHIFTETGLNVKYKFKGYVKVRQDLIDERKTIVVAEAIVEADSDLVVEVEAEPVASKDTSNAIFKRLVIAFEKEHTKIINKCIYVKKTDESIILMNEKTLLATYRHKQCGVNAMGCPVLFINKWITFNDKINQKQNMGTYPNPALCPADSFNLWLPFPMELLKHKPYTKHDVGLKVMLNHIKILSGNEEVVYKYFLGWIAMMIQKPEVKTKCIVLVSEEGAGKGALMELFKLMLGENKVFETSDPARDVWGAFNSLMIDAYLVNINELEFKATKDAEGKIKTLITDKAMIINNKGLNQIKITSCHKVLITTNKDKCLKTHNNDRRTLIARSSDEKVNDTKYFKDFHAYLANEEVIRTCYDYFMNYDLVDFDDKAIIRTDYHNDLSEATQSPVLSWLESFTYAHRHTKVLPPMTGVNIYDLFKEWSRINNRPFSTDATNLGRIITNFRISGIEEGKRVNNLRTKVFKITDMIKHFKIEAENEVDNITVEVVENKVENITIEKVENITIEKVETDTDDIEYIDVEEYVEEGDVVEVVLFKPDQQDPPPFGIPVKRKPKL